MMSEIIVECAADIKPERPVSVEQDSLDAMRCGGGPEVRMIVWRRLAFAYGMWTTSDGREVVYNRRYRPLWERKAGAQWQRASYAEWVQEITDHKWFYNDGNSEAQKRSLAKKAMLKLGVPVPLQPNKKNGPTLAGSIGSAK